MATKELEIRAGQRFAFGRNWARFLSTIDEQRISEAEQSLRAMLEVRNLAQRTFLDIGCGSGLFSLVARRLGAKVHSFDYDRVSVSCTAELQRRFAPDDSEWRIEEGSILDSNYVNKLGTFDVVYSWGVLHHTGALWRALDEVTRVVSPGGQLFIAIYNDQGWISKYWWHVKRAFNASAVLKLPLVLLHAPYLLGIRFGLRWIRGRRTRERGMSLWYDMVDWLGGFPFETAKPEDVIHFFLKRSYQLQRLTTCGGRHGCNQFVFRAPPLLGRLHTS